jgi:hypothetical protein
MDDHMENGNIVMTEATLKRANRPIMQIVNAWGDIAFIIGP